MTGQQLKQRTLASTRSANQPDPFPCPDCKVQTVEYARSIGVAIAHTIQLDGAIRHLKRPCLWGINDCMRGSE